MKRFLSVIIALFCCTAVSAQLYHAGERLEYRVSYRARLFPNTEMAVATLSTSLDTLDGRPVYKVFGRCRILPSYRWFYDIDDRYTIWVDTATLSTDRFLSELKEGSYRKTTRFRYDWEAMRSYNTWVKRDGRERSRTLDLSPESKDAVSLFFNLRDVDLDTFREGDVRKLEMVLEDTIRTLRYRFIGRETKRIRRMGKFRTLKFSCQIGTQEAHALTDGAEFFIWISDDENKIPLWLESPIKVGSVCAYIVSYEGLKYPLTSKLK